MQAHQRHIVVAVDFEERDNLAMRFLLDSLWRPGTVVNLVHVVLAREEYNEVFHGAHRCCQLESVPDSPCVGQIMNAWRCGTVPAHSTCIAA